MTTQHTPGPWALVETAHETTISDWKVHIGEDRVSVFPYKRIYSDDRTRSGLVIDRELMANARLIAAAPDLLEALQHLLVAHGKQLDYAFQQAQEAIAKATGETK